MQQGIVLKLLSYGQAADQCAKMTKKQLKSEHGVELIVNAVFRRDFMPVISEAYKRFSDLLSTRRGLHESLKSFGACFSPRFAKFNSISDTSKLPMHKRFDAFMLLNIASIEHS